MKYIINFLKKISQLSCMCTLIQEMHQYVRKYILLICLISWEYLINSKFSYYYGNKIIKKKNRVRMSGPGVSFGFKQAN